MITDILQSIATVAQKIYEEVQRAKANQAQCQLLKTRIDVIVKATKDLEKVPNADHYRPGLVALKSCLDEALKFIQEFSKDTGWFKKVLKAGTAEAQFKQINENLHKTIEQLNLGLIAQQILNREQDIKAQKIDFEGMQKQQDIIAKLNQEAINALQKLKFDQTHQNEIVLKQLASMRAKLTGTAVKLEIEAHLLVPYHELMFNEMIGEGGFGKVYLGQWNEQTVAIKSVDGITQAEHEQFVREVQIMSRLHSPHIVQLYGACLEAESHCLVMEHMTQGSLHQVLGEKTLTPKQQKAYAISIAKGLFYLHSKGIVHCDLKSANILISAHHEAKLTDFGISKTATQSIKATAEKSQAIAWQAPECLQKHPKFTMESDIYAFGMIVWEMVTGKRPFASLDKKGICDAVLSGKGETLPKEMPEFYQKLISSCWHSDPHKRPNLKTLITQLENYNPASAEEDFEQGRKHEAAKAYQEAFACYKKAVAQNHLKAHTNLGFMYLNGLGTDKNLPQALDCFTTAAKGGHVRAMMNLATMCQYGQGVAVDLSQALEWYNKAASLGDEKAKTLSLKLQNNFQTNPMPKGVLFQKAQAESAAAPAQGAVLKPVKDTAVKPAIQKAAH
jgi:hypothetical protein